MMSKNPGSGRHAPLKEIIVSVVSEVDTEQRDERPGLNIKFLRGTDLWRPIQAILEPQ